MVHPYCASLNFHMTCIWFTLHTEETLPAIYHIQNTHSAKPSTSNSIAATSDSTSPSFQSSIEFSPEWSCTCICWLVWLTYHFKVIDSLMQDVWVSSYKQTDQFWPPIFRTIRPQQTPLIQIPCLFSCLTSFSCNHGFAQECPERRRYFVRVICEYTSSCLW